MKPAEAEKLLGGYATGTLTEDERQTLFAAALGHQDIFDALMDEEALRELLADPVMKAQLLAALAPAAQPKVVPFWRRSGLLSAAAGLIVAATAGLAYLRSPEKAPPPLQQEAIQTPKVKAAEAPAVAQVPVASVRKIAPVPAPKEVTRLTRAAEVAMPPSPAPSQPLSAAPATGASASNGEDGYQARAKAQAQAEYHRAEAQDQAAKKAEASRPTAAAMMEVVGSLAPPPSSPPPAKAMAKAKASAHGGARQDAAPIRITPTWNLEALPDGSRRVTVMAPRGLQVVLLKRGAAGIVVLQIRATEDSEGPFILWRTEFRLAAGDALDLYLLNTPTADQALLPETGPVDGFRARIHPAAK